MYVMVNNTSNPKTDLEKKYLVQLKKLTTEDLRYLISLLYCEPSWVMNGNLFEDLEDEDKIKHRDIWLKLSMFDKSKYDQLIETLKNEYDIFREEFGADSSSVKRLLLIKIAETYLNLRSEGKELSDDQKINSIHCFTSSDSANTYKIVVNEDYSVEPLSVSKSMKVWSMMIELIQNGSLDRNEETKRLYDYFNFNPNNLITKNTKYPLQTIIEQSDSEYKPKFKGNISTDKTLTQRQNRLKKTT